MSSLRGLLAFAAIHGRALGIHALALSSSAQENTTTDEDFELMHLYNTGCVHQGFHVNHGMHSIDKGFHGSSGIRKGTRFEHWCNLKPFETTSLNFSSAVAYKNDWICEINLAWATAVTIVYALMALIATCTCLQRNNFQLRDAASPQFLPLFHGRQVHYLKWISPFLLVLVVSKLMNFNVQIPGLYAAILMMPVTRLYRQLLTDPRSLWATWPWSGKSCYCLVAETKDIFLQVHPVTNDALCLAHIISYWPGILKYVQGNLYDYLFWWCIMMVFSPFTESLHTYTAPVAAEQRNAFIAKRKRHFVDEMVRNELGPVLVYFVLLPKYLCEKGGWSSKMGSDKQPTPRQND